MLFSSIDASGNNYINLDEMKTFLLQQNVDIEEDSDVEILLAALDIDRDGRVSRHDFVEFFGF